MLLSYKPLHLEAQQRLQEEGCVVDINDEQTMARFLNGLNHPMKNIADFQPYSNLIELVHQATKAERQVQYDLKYAKYSSKIYGFSNIQASTTSPTSTSTKLSSRFRLRSTKVRGQHSSPLVAMHHHDRSCVCVGFF